MYVYLAKAPFPSASGGQVFKIGYTSNPDKRKKSLGNTSVLYDYSLLYTYQTHLANAMEKYLFSMLYSRRLRKKKEFFIFSNEAEAINIVSDMCRAFETGTAPKGELVTSNSIINKLEDRWYAVDHIV